MLSQAAIQDFSKIRGAIYIPSRAFNSYQMWKDYEISDIERDVHYASSIHLNALRIWISYEYWLEDKEELENKLEHFLQTCIEKGIRVLPSLFEKAGIEPTEEARNDKNPLTAVNVISPSSHIYEDETRWNETEAFVNWMMKRYKDDERLLAIEVMNEPGDTQTYKFARAMLKTAAGQKGSQPLTVAVVRIEDNIYFSDIGLDILQHHMNFPKSKEWIQERMSKLEMVQKVLNKPVLLTEWQRIREGGNGWGETPIAGEELQSNYAPYANTVEPYSIGTFFWSLMVKPAYLLPQRKKGTLNGLFHEDGAVWSLEDARAISRNPDFQAEERKEWPEWCKQIPEVYLSTKAK